MSERDTLKVTGNIRILNSYEGSCAAMCCCIFSSNRQIALGWSDGTVEVRNSTTLELLKLFDSPDENCSVTSLSANESEQSSPRLLASYASGHTILWDIQQGIQIFSVKDERQTLVNTFSTEFDTFATSGTDAKINLHDARDASLRILLQGTSHYPGSKGKKTVKVYFGRYHPVFLHPLIIKTLLDPEVMDCHKDRVFCLRYHPSRDNELLSGGWDDTVQFWDVRFPYSNRKIHGPHICGNDAIEFVTDETFITASWRKTATLEVWDYGTGNLEETIVPDDSKCFLYCCTIIQPDNILLVGGAFQNMLRIIDFTAKMSIASISGLKGAVYFAKELPKAEGSASFTKQFCFNSDNVVYRAEVEI